MIEGSVLYRIEVRIAKFKESEKAAVHFFVHGRRPPKVWVTHSAVQIVGLQKFLFQICLRTMAQTIKIKMLTRLWRQGYSLKQLHKLTSWCTGRSSG
jgi:hypothetical protein